MITFTENEWQEKITSTLIMILMMHVNLNLLDRTQEYHLYTHKNVAIFISRVCNYQS